MKMSLPRIVLIIFVSLLFPASALLASSVNSNTGNVVETPLAFQDSILIQKKIFSKMHRIGLYPDAMQKVVFFTVRGEQGKVYQLYVFNLEGQLVKQTEIRNKQTSFIEHIEKGTYLFDVFCDDDKIGNGQIAVR